MRVFLLTFIAGLAACTPSATVVQAPDGTLIAMRRGTGFQSSTGPLRVQALKDADEYCAASNKRANVLRSREIPAMGHWPEGEVSFVCQ